MNRSANTPSRAGWRRSSRSAAPAGPSGGYVVGQSAAPRLKLMFRVSLFAALMLGLGVILYLILRPAPPSLPLVAVAVTQYHAASDRSLPPPPNPFAAEDLERFERLFSQRNDGFTRNVQFYDRAAARGGALTMRESQFMQRLLDPVRTQKVDPGGPNGNVLAFFISAPGQTDQAGQPCLLLADSRPEDESTWLRIEDLLTQLREAIDQNPKMRAGTRAIVFLDASRWPGQWTWGDLHNTFAVRCQTVVQKLDDANTAVILSASSGQRSWFDLRSGGSLFGIALAEAFGGEADGKGAQGRADGWISLGEMVAYLQGRVSAAAEAVWHAQQLPDLLTTAEEASGWTVMSRPSGRSPSLTEATDSASRGDRLAALEERWMQVDELWQGYDRLLQQATPPESYDPVTLAALEHRLQRLDQLAISGSSYQPEFDALLNGLDGCKALLRSLQRQPLRVNQTPPELALLERFAAAEPPDPVEQEALAQDWQKWQVKADPAEWKRKLSESTAVELLWGDGGWLEQQGFTAPALATADRFLQQAQALPEDGAQLLETHLIRLFAQPDLQHVAGPPAEVIRDALRASRGAMLPDDLRASYWLQDPIQEVEQERRLATDWVLAEGADGEGLNRLRQLTASDGRFDRLTQQGQRLSQAYRTYDRALHRLPRLAETLLTDAEAFETSAGAEAPLRAATEAVVTLGDQLQVPLGTISESRIAAVIAAAEVVDGMLEGLERRLASRVSRVVEGEADDQHKLRQALTLLTGAGVTEAQARRELRRVMVDPRSPTMGPPMVSNATVMSDPLVDETSAARGLLLGGHHFLTHWLYMTQPAAGGSRAPVGDAAAPADDAMLLKTLEHQGATVRKAIGDFLSSDLGDVRSEPRSRLQAGGTSLEARQKLAELDREVRAKTLLITSDRTRISPVPSLLYGLDHQLFMTLMGRRILDDFWCEAKPDETAFFADAAERALNMLSTGWSDLPPLIRGASVEELRKQRRLAASSRQTLQPVGESIMYRSTAIPATVVQLRVPADLPDQGIVAVSADHNPVVKTVPLATAEQPAVLETAVMVPADLDDSVRAVEVRSFFRGLRRSGQLMLNRRQGARLATFQLPQYGPPRVLVSGEAAEPVPIVFVLDCSDSMKAVDITMPDGTKQSRMVVARETLRELLETMHKTGQFRVGLILYGHRWGWKTQDGLLYKTADNPVRYRAYDRRTGGHRDVSKNDRDGNPVYDVEVVGPLGQATMDGEQLARLQGSLDQVEPWGTTPLYQSIAEAFQQFQNLQPRPPSGQVVVLTDGAEETAPFYVSQSGVAQQAAKFWEQRNVNLTVLLINQPEDAAAIRSALKAQVIPVNNRNQLHASLDALVPRTQYEVLRADGETVGTGELGEAVTVEPWPPAGVTVLEGRPVLPGQRYRVQLDPGNGSPVASEVRLQGGEYLELALRGRRALEHVRYDAEQRNPQTVKMSGPGHEAISVMVLRPEPPIRQVLEIPVVVQNADPTQFSPRPAAFWADVMAVGASGDSRSLQYCVTDMEFVTGQSVPLIRCRLWDWPAWATSASLRLWVAMNPVTSRELPLMPLDQPIDVDGIQGVQFVVSRQTPETGGYQWSIREQYQQTETPRGVFRLKIDLHPLPDEASHYYYPESGEVEHVFHYRRVVTGVTAQVTEHADFAAQAASNEVTVKVPIPKR